MQEQLVTIDINDGVADVRLNRPEKYNALSQSMFKAIIDAGEQLRDKKKVCVLLCCRETAGGFARDWIWTVLPKWATATKLRPKVEVKRSHY